MIHAQFYVSAKGEVTDRINFHLSKKNTIFFKANREKERNPKKQHFIDQECVYRTRRDGICWFLLMAPDFCFFFILFCFAHFVSIEQNNLYSWLKIYCTSDKNHTKYAQFVPLSSVESKSRQVELMQTQWIYNWYSPTSQFCVLFSWAKINLINSSKWIFVWRCTKQPTKIKCLLSTICSLYFNIYLEKLNVKSLSLLIFFYG